MSHEEIAIAFEISRPTLEKYFAWELTVGAYRCRMEVMEAMHRTAKKGNVAAQKAYSALMVKVAAPPLPPDQQAVPEGKKAQANAAAVTAQKGTDWDSLLSTGPVQ